MKKIFILFLAVWIALSCSFLASGATTNVMVVQDGKYYHTRICEKFEVGQVYSCTQEQAIESGYSSCPVCYKDGEDVSPFVEFGRILVVMLLIAIFVILIIVIL